MKKRLITTENYSLRLRTPGEKKIVNEFSSTMNQAAGYVDKQIISQVSIIRRSSIFLFVILPDCGEF